MQGGSLILYALVLAGAVLRAEMISERRFEAEEVLENPEAVLRDRSRKGLWNLWSTDRDAAKKWSGGAVLRGNVVKEGAVPGTTVPVLRFRIPIVRDGRYDLNVKLTRTVGISLDGGKTWRKQTGAGLIFSNRPLKAGESVPVRISGDFPDPGGPGAPCIDYFTLTPAASSGRGLKNSGFEESSVGLPPKDWRIWSREKGEARAIVTEEAHSGRQGVSIVASGIGDWAFYHTALLPVRLGERFELTAWVKNGARSGPDAELQVVSCRNGSVINYAMAALPLKESGRTWRKRQLNFTVPSGVDAIRIRVAGRGACNLAMDDFSIAVCDSRSSRSELVKLPGADFESDPAGSPPEFWRCWTRDGMVLSAVVEKTEENGRSARLRFSGKQDWSFTLHGIVPVNPRQIVRVSCRARKAGAVSGDVSVEVMGFQNGTLMDYGFRGMPLKELSERWKEFSAQAMVPADCNGIGLRLIGTGPCDVAVDDFLVEKLAGAPPSVKSEHHPVKGFAAKRVVEKLDRGLMALPAEGGIYLSWRQLSSDDPKIGFDVFQVVGGKEQKLNAVPVVQTTDFFVRNPAKNATYQVRPAAGFSGVAGAAKPLSGKFDRSPYIAYKLSDPKARADKIGIGDLDGDGRYDFVVRYGNGGMNVDPFYLYWKPSKQPLTLEAIGSDGTMLWKKSLGWNIESGIWYSPFIVYDVNGDGRAEVVLKASDPDAGDLREKTGPDKGRVTTGAEYLMVLDGMTGREIARAPWPSRALFEGVNMAYNYYSRNQLAVGYLDGKNPCIVALRGTYGLMLAEAWQLKDGRLELLWKYNSGDYGRKYHGQGAHTTRMVDIDGDGRDEIILGGAVLDDDGRPLWSTGHGHPDYLYVTNITNRNPGLEVVTIYETACRERGGFTCADAKTGRLIWELDKPSSHIHYGYAGDIDPRYRGWEVGGSDTGGDQRSPAISRHYSPDGELLRFGENAPYRGMEHFLYWDADLQREHVAPVITDFNGGPSGGGFEGRFLMQADLFGDWREEALTVMNGEFRIYSTTIPAMDRRVCLMEDLNYRLTVAAGSMGYIYDPALSYLPTDLAPNLNLTFKDKVTAGDLEVVVSAPLKEAVKGKLKLFASGGIRLEPKEWEVDLQSGALKVFQVKVKKPADTVSPIRAELTLANGTVLRGQVPTGIKLPSLPRLEGVIAEAEEFVSQIGGRVVIRSDKLGVHGKCFSHWDEKGHTLTWNLVIPKEGKYLLRIRYASAEDARRLFTLNGKSLGVFKI